MTPKQLEKYSSVRNKWMKQGEKQFKLALLIYADLCELIAVEQICNTYYPSQIEAIRCIADDKGL